MSIRVLNLRDDKNCLQSPKSIYIGRQNTAFNLTASVWANPEHMNNDSLMERERVVVAYIEMLLRDYSPIVLRERVQRLDGSDLVCYCHPSLCHGHVLMLLAVKECWAQPEYNPYRTRPHVYDLARTLHRAAEKARLSITLRDENTPLYEPSIRNLMIARDVYQRADKTNVSESVAARRTLEAVEHEKANVGGLLIHARGCAREAIAAAAQALWVYQLGDYDV